MGGQRWRIDGVVSAANLDVLRRFPIRRSRHPILNSELASALRAEKVGGVWVTRISWIVEAYTFMRGPRCYCTYQSQISDSASEHDLPVKEGVEQDLNALWEVSPTALLSPPPVLDTDMDLVTVPIEEGDIVEGLVSIAVGLIVEGSTTEILHINGSRRKVRLLANVIQNVRSSAEKEVSVEGLKGHGRPCMKIGPFDVAWILLSDSDLRNRKDIIL
ncbi:hypothetical protein V6N12_013562 [Hibiscus sabdariffa]|uniref:Uncharacterized protein n=1 Tax=Hibiscus sabdariffa TaxID=183260 RepID=A0ABR2C9S4_9ROSI